MRDAQAHSAGNSVSSDLVPLAHDLAKLYLKLGRGESAVRVLEQMLHDKTMQAEGESKSDGGKHDDAVGSAGGGGRRGVRIAGGADVEDMRQDVLTLLLLVTVKEKTDGYKAPNPYPDPNPNFNTNANANPSPNPNPKPTPDRYSHDEVSASLRSARVRQTDVISALRSGGAGKDTVDLEKARLSELSQRLVA